MSQSPFSFFRKYDKILLTVAGVLAILVFTVGDSLMKIGQDERITDNIVVATWSEGEIRQDDLRNWAMSRQRLAVVLMDLYQAASAGGAQPSQRPIVVEQVVNERSTVYTMLLNRKAQEMGVTISDGHIREYIMALTADALDDDKISGIIARRGWTIDKVFDALRHEMASNEVQQLFYGAASGTTPAAELDYYLRVNRRVAADIVAFPVADFIDQVPNPTAKELKEYFERFKMETSPVDQFGSSTLDSPLPGFKQPRKAAVEYFFADFAEFEKRIVVTEEEMLAYYEENKDQFIEAELPAIDDETSEGEQPAEEGTSEEKSDEEKTPPAGETGEEAPTGEESTEAASEEPAPSDEQPEAADEPAASETGEVETPAEGATESTEGSFAPGDETEETTEEATEETPSEETPVVDDPKTDEPETEESSTEEPAEPGAADEETPADDTPATEPGDDVPATEPGTETPATETPGTEPETPAKEVKYQPYEDVKEQVRERIARPKAREEITELFTELRERLQDYNIRLASVTADTPDSQRPQRPNFAAIAKSKGLKSGETKVLSMDQFETETEIGKSFEFRIANRQFLQIPYVDLLFRQSGPTSLFRPIETDDANFNKYLSWKTQDEESFVPTLDQARDQAIRSWKIGAGVEDDSKHARGLARQAAAKMVEQASAPSASLLELGRKAGRTEIETNLFSWIEAPIDPRNQPQVSLSSVNGVEQPGPEFFSIVTALPINGLGVTMNHPETFAYAVKVVEEERSRKTLVDDFLAGAGSQMVMMSAQQAMQFDWQQVAKTWLDDLEKEYKLDWKVEPDQDEG